MKRLCAHSFYIMNINNLVSMGDRTQEEKKNISAKGGKASGEARRRKKNLKQVISAALECPATSAEAKKLFKQFNIKKSADNQNAIVLGLINEAINGNVQAFKEIRNLIGEDNDTERLKLQKREFKCNHEKHDNSEQLSKIYEALEEQE